MRPTFTKKQVKFLNSKGFRVLKYKADADFGDDRHLILIQLEREWPGLRPDRQCENPFIMKIMKYTGRYSVGKSYELKPDCSTDELGKVLIKLSKNKKTLWSEICTAIYTATHE